MSRWRTSVRWVIGHRLHRSAVVILLAAAIALVFGLVTEGRSGSARADVPAGDLPTAQVNYESQPCASGAVLPSFTSFTLGSDFEVMALTDSGSLCAANPATPPSVQGDSVVEPPATVPYSSRVYGTCDLNNPSSPAESEGLDGCAPPLEIQSWPECARNLSSYTFTAPDGSQQPFPSSPVDLGSLVTSLLPRLPMLSTDLASVAPALVDAVPKLASDRDAVDPSLTQAVTSAFPSLMSELSEIPAASFEDGTRLELYVGDTTIVVFADDPNVADDAAALLALAKLTTSGLNQTAQDLQNLANSTSGCSA